jgi:hypothetical protein
MGIYDILGVLGPRILRAVSALRGSGERAEPPQ